MTRLEYSVPASIENILLSVSDQKSRNRHPPTLSSLGVFYYVTLDDRQLVAIRCAHAAFSATERQHACL
eukprot:3573830-Pleurochrysis_carterae.AAC.1